MITMIQKYKAKTKVITNYTKSKEKRILQGSNENPKHNYVNCLIPGKKGGWLDQRWSFSSESDFLREWQEFSGPIIKVKQNKVLIAFIDRLWHLLVIPLKCSKLIVFKTNKLRLLS